MYWNVPISAGQTGYIIDGRSRGCNSELVDGSIDQGRISVSGCISSRAEENWVSWMRECVWCLASSQAFYAFERSVQITVIVVCHHRFDLQLQSDGRAAGLAIKPGRLAPRRQNAVFEQKQKDVHRIYRGAFIRALLAPRIKGKVMLSQATEVDLLWWCQPRKSEHRLKQALFTS